MKEILQIDLVRRISYLGGHVISQDIYGFDGVRRGRGTIRTVSEELRGGVCQAAVRFLPIHHGPRDCIWGCKDGGAALR